MKVTITRTSDCYEATPVVGDWNNFDNLSDLLKWVDAQRYPVILTTVVPNMEYKAEIYDSWRE